MSNNFPSKLNTKFRQCATSHHVEIEEQQSDKIPKILEQEDILSRLKLKKINVISHEENKIKFYE